MTVNIILTMKHKQIIIKTMILMIFLNLKPKPSTVKSNIKILEIYKVTITFLHIIIKKKKQEKFYEWLFFKFLIRIM